MVTFCVLVLPLPYAAKRKLFHFLSESPVIAKIAYGIKIAFMSVAPTTVPQSCELIATPRPQLDRCFVR
jgi:hypothetical protein